MAELGGNGIVFSFNGREVGNGRFHPALLQLNADGSGTIQNSNNIVTEVPLQQVAFGEEYITDLQFDPGNTTLIGAGGNPPVVRRGGSGTMTATELLLGILLAAFLHFGLPAFQHFFTAFHRFAGQVLFRTEQFHQQAVAALPHLVQLDFGR